MYRESGCQVIALWRYGDCPAPAIVRHGVTESTSADVRAVCRFRAARDVHPSVMLFKRMLFTSSGVVMKVTLQLLSTYLDGGTLSDNLFLGQF